MVKKIVITTFGFLGDLNPYLALARRLNKDGHYLLIATSEYYRATVKKAGIDFYPVRPDIDVGDHNFVSLVMEPRTGSKILVRQVLLSRPRDSYRDLLEVARDSDLLITHPLTFAGPLVAEMGRIPWVSTVLSPISFFSAYDLPVLPPYAYLKKLDFLAPFTARLLLRFVRAATRHLSEPVRLLRAEIGLPPGKNPFFEGQFSPAMTLGLFSPLLAKRRPDWPQASRITGFLFYDEALDGGAESPKVSRKLEKFLDSGPLRSFLHWGRRL